MCLRMCVSKSACVHMCLYVCVCMYVCVYYNCMLNGTDTENNDRE